MRTLLRACAAVALAVLAGGCGGGGGGSTAPDAAFLTADPRGMTTGGLVGDASGAPQAPGAEASTAGVDMAREIAQADVYRVVGDTLYLANTHRGLVVVDLAGSCVLGRVGLGGFPHEMFVRGSRAFVLVSGADGDGEVVQVSLENLAAPTVTGRAPIGGWYRTSRLVGDVLYVVTGGGVRSFALDPSLAAVDTAVLPHEAAFLHATDAWLVVAGWDMGTSTPVTLVDISDPAGGLVVRGTIALAGWMSDDFKMDLRGSVLRAVTHDAMDGGLSRLFTVDVSDPDAPGLLATLEIARGEQLFATRFDADAAYLVTFEQVDPLWVVDLRDPSAPAVSGSLTVPGWSTHLVPTGNGRLVAIGVEVDAGWNVVASLFDVHDPTAPTMLDRSDLGAGSSSALYDVKALGVFPADGYVLVPLSDAVDRLCVLRLTASTLDLRGSVPLEGAVLRGLPHTQGIVGISTEEVAVVDPATLAVRRRCTIAENVVDVDRLPDGRVLPLVAHRATGRLGDVTLPLSPERMYRYGFHVAVVGWDALGRAARVVDFTAAPPRVSERFDLGGAWYVLGDPAWGMARPEGMGYGGMYGSGEAVLTDDGRLVVHGLPSGGFDGGPAPLAHMMDGGAMPPAAADGAGVLDGFVVIDVVHAALEAPIDVVDGYVTGFVADDGGDLVFTVGRPASEDRQGRPRMAHDLVRVDLPTRATTAPVNVPGSVLSAEGDLVFTSEDRWTDGWDWECAVVALSIEATGSNVLDRHVLPAGAWDLRAAGATLYFLTTTYPEGDPVVGAPIGRSGTVSVDVAPGPWASPTTSLHTLRLGPALGVGPTITEEGVYRSLLLPEDGACLTVRDGLTVERWDVAGASAQRTWEAAVDGYPWTARSDPMGDGYLVALGYAGYIQVP